MDKLLKFIENNDHVIGLFLTFRSTKIAKCIGIATIEHLCLNIEIFRSTRILNHNLVVEE